jgi:hypothetical protein
MTVLCVIAGSLVTQSTRMYSRLAKSEAPQLVLLTVARGKKNRCPKTTLRLRFYQPPIDT